MSAAPDKISRYQAQKVLLSVNVVSALLHRTCVTYNWVFVEAVQKVFLKSEFIFRFNCVWDNRDAEHGELAEYKMLYFLQDDTISVKVSLPLLLLLIITYRVLQIGPIGLKKVLGHMNLKKNSFHTNSVVGT